MPSPSDIFPVPGVQTRRYTLADIQSGFGAMDIDKNGCLDDSDLRNMLLLAGENASEEEIREMIRMVDHDGTGIVSFDEFAQLFLYPDALFQNMDILPARDDAIDLEELDQSRKQIQGNSQTLESRSTRLTLMSQLTDNGRMTPADVKRIFANFNKFDQDGSGFVGYREFLLVLDKEDSDAMQALFKLFDLDGSGEIELKEFVIGLTFLIDQASSDRTKFAFKLYDMDNSGFLDRPELLLLVKANLKAQGQVQIATNEQWLDRRVDLLYDQLKIPRNSPISEAKFNQLAKLAPDLILPALEELAGIGAKLTSGLPIAN